MAPACLMRASQILPEPASEPVWETTALLEDSDPRFLGCQRVLTAQMQTEARFIGAEFDLGPAAPVVSGPQPKLR